MREVHAMTVVQNLPTRPPITHRCACGRTASYTDTLVGWQRWLCHGCWRQYWVDQLAEGPDCA